ncbi:TetR family transcriptional regulator C-terminal domain-containing protein [Microbacterium sp. zg.Y1090]|uniref:TetR-like C-terminal domain-containing protein n=1 Tax=Microbacterium TaxID=33882 RepID=UPI00214CDB37|nr:MULTISPECIES: TetR-like C-terminal domain-containing protein [unclassified Microbacterium]MCR2813921.1 TetR family transcriptional regulator C-terminal domain-containing protein [Microbacterium sp. zg.Y1084]MCR2819195.1 TetR family transcriptional regulator C-terminal domain-containing protein [Microbacterium sp. zg.Y1090]MDL5487104.1 TetR-like C-terminal domain-containing protein [Microbacterium sp. zg-Y1211]WIM28179.1 TetR-like C-terminal domain-containing protein [Microbacterium sp. zg-Y1
MAESADPQHRSDARRALAAALKARLRTEPLDKVTVTELTRDCGLTRQAFYYHFADVRGLAVWVFETEVAGRVRSFASDLGWADGLVRLMLYMRENRAATLAVLDGLGRSGLERFLFAQMRPITESVVDREGAPARPQDRVLVVDFYTSAVLAVVLRWVSDGMVEHPYRVVGDLEIMLHGAVHESVHRLDARALDAQERRTK